MFAYGQQAGKNVKNVVEAPIPVNKAFVFKGKVEKVDLNAKTVVVTNEGIPGWRFSMTAKYTVNNPEVLMTLTPGDRVTATVYGGNLKVLYGLRVVPPEDLPFLIPRKKYK